MMSINACLGTSLLGHRPTHAMVIASTWPACSREEIAGELAQRHEMHDGLASGIHPHLGGCVWCVCVASCVPRGCGGLSLHISPHADACNVIIYRMAARSVVFRPKLRPTGPPARRMARF